MALCSDSGGPFEFLNRPFTYRRSPFQLASGELLTYEGEFFSRPASGLLMEKRIFTSETSHPVPSTVKLYINKDASNDPIIEPDDDGTLYQTATPHYVDYILDMRDLIADVSDANAADSEHTAREFFEAHLARVRSSYDFSNYEIAAGQYVHPSPTGPVPSGASPPGSPGSIPPPGDGFELGAQQIMDIDIDEIQWQPLPRPGEKLTALAADIPIEPFYPLAIKPGGSLPDFSSLDEENLNQLGLGVTASGGVLVTGDLLIDTTSIKLTTGSGVLPDGTGTFIANVPWRLFPCGRNLCEYYPVDDPDATITARGRQAIFTVPGPTAKGVYLLNASSISEASGVKVQHYPSHFHSTSGIDANGHAHDGIHVTDKLIYNLSNLGPAGTAVGHSPHNGRKVLVHYIGTETSVDGETFRGTGPKYANGDTIYGAGNIVLPFDGTDFSTVRWAQTNNTFSPVTFSNLRTSALGPRRGVFGAPDGITYNVADIMASSARIITRKKYAQWGFIDQIVAPDLDRAQGGQIRRATINYVTREYFEGKNADGSFKWVELPQSPSSHSSQIIYYDNTFFINNVFSFFFDRKPNNGFVHVNGDVYIQWSPRNAAGVDTLPRKNFFAPIGIGTNVLVPSRTRSDVIISIGFFPNWARRRYVTTNNQISRPGDIRLTPADSSFITFDPDLDFDDTFVNEFGPPVWDPDEGVNYLYFLWTDLFTSRLFFAHMDTDFVIFRINQVETGVLFGKSALLSI